MKSQEKRNEGKDGQQKARKSLADYVYITDTGRQSSEFAIITKYLINHIRREYTNGDDIATAVEGKAEFDFTSQTPKINPDFDATDKTKINNNYSYKAIFEAELKVFVERKETYRANEAKSYAFLMNQCSKALQNKIRERNDFASKIKNKPIELLKAIEQHCISFQVNKYEMSTILDALKAVINIRQKEDESLVDYTARFKSARGVLTAQLGEPIELKKYMTTSQITDKKKAYEELMAHVYLESADKSKYGSLVAGLHSQFSLGNNQFPKTLVETSNVLSNHKHDLQPATTAKVKTKLAKSKALHCHLLNLWKTRSQITSMPTQGSTKRTMGD